MNARYLILVAALAVPAPAQAQLQEPDVVEQLVAVVGDSVVLFTQVVEELQRMQLQGLPVPPPNDPGYPAAFSDVVEQFVDRLVVLQAAASDSLLAVDDASIEENVNGEIQRLAADFGGQAALQQALASEALTLSEYRDMLRTNARTDRIQQLFFQSRLASAPEVEVSEDEMLERFQEARSTLEQRPKLITFRQVVIVPEASEQAKDSARVEAENLLERVNGGEDFAELARIYSDDPGTASLGGDLGWFRRGRMVREFEEAAFNLIDDQVSDVVETDYGFHIIKVERYRAGERQARHILISPEKNDQDVQNARDLAVELQAQAMDGASMRTLWEEHGDPTSPDSMTIAFDQIGELPPAYAILRTTAAGQFRAPIEYELPTGETRIVVAHVLEVREAGAYTFDDLKAQIAGQLRQEKQFRQILEELRATTYIDIRM
ncbi:MAG: peptidylprolyl isomerase [Gemmatimonadota bacterium]